MIKPRIFLPLSVQLSLGLVANFAILLLLFVWLPGRSGLGWDLLLTQPARERLLEIGDTVGRELSQTPEAEWPLRLVALGSAYGVSFEVNRLPPRGPQHDRPSGPPSRWDRPPAERGGWDEPLPAAFGSAAPRTPPPDQERGRSPPQNDLAVRADMIAVRSEGWSRFTVRIPSSVQGRPTDIWARAGGISALLGLLGIADWVWFGLLSLLVTALLWVPFAWRVTRAVKSLTAVTETIAQGRFDSRAPLVRRDELGQLAMSVNLMASRLERQLESQKQFVSDVAHEVTAPLARLRIGLELLHPQLPEAAQARHRDLEEDAEQMSALLEELLMFSRAEQWQGHGAAETVALATLVAEALAQESAETQFELAVPGDLMVRVPAALMRRALANLIRNALRHGQQGREIAARRHDGMVQISVADRGSGVPAAALPHLGEPFYRPEFARSRETGGTGLGLAIVRRCVSAAGGQVLFRNREGGGFEALLQLPAA